MDCNKLGFPVLHYLTEFAQTYIPWVGDAIQPSHPLSSPFPPAFNLSQHQGLFQWASSSHQVAKVLWWWRLTSPKSAGWAGKFWRSSALVWTFVHPPPQLICWNPNASWGGVRRWSLREWLGLEGRALANALRKRLSAPLSPLLPLGIQWEVCTPEENPHLTALALWSWPSSSRTVRKKFLLFIILWYFIMVAWMDQDTQEELRLQFKSPGRIPPCSGGCWRRKWLPAPVFLPGRSHGQGNLWGCNPWGRKSWTWLSDCTTTMGEVRLVVCSSLQLIGWGSLKLWGTICFTPKSPISIYISSQNTFPETSRLMFD